jgi:glycosyltransferase involved in cell wall biosynthesis
MIIGIDCRTLSGQMNGVNRYLKNLLSTLSEIDAKNKYILFSDKEFLNNVNLGDNFKKEILRNKSNLLWEQFILPKFLNDQKVDIFHCPHNYGVPCAKRWKVVLTLYDIIPYKFPNFWKNRSKVLRFMYKLSLNNAISKADKIIVVSQSSKKDIINTFRLSERIISVIPGAVDARFNTHNPSKGKNSENFSSDKDYILHIGGLGFNKNTETVLLVYENLKRKYNFKHKLLIVGKKGWFSKEILKKSELIEGVVFTGYVPDEKMPLLYSGATVFLYLSLYEGFGFPVLEAMACGVPVVVSKNSSLPEVAGNAGLYVDSCNIEDICKKILLVLNDVGLRSQLISKGLERTKEFSWDLAASRTLKVYEEVMN